MDKNAIEYHVKEILKAIGEDPEREGLRETPQRVARMCEEVFAGIALSNHEIAEMFGKTFEDGSLNAAETADAAETAKAAKTADAAYTAQTAETAVVMKDITVFSYCEHHMALMYDMHVNVAYIPKGRVLGLSKIARICDMASKRLQLQERLGRDIAEIISEAAGSPDVGVMICGAHSCMTARGIRNASAMTTTTTFMGAFRTDPELRKLIF